MHCITVQCLGHLLTALAGVLLCHLKIFSHFDTNFDNSKFRKGEFIEFWFDFHRRTNLFAVLLWFLMALWSSISIVAGFCFFTNSPVSDCGVYVKKDNWWYRWWKQYRLWWLLVWCWALVFIWCLVGGGTLLGIGGAAFLLVFGPGRVNIERQDKIEGYKTHLYVSSHLVSYLVWHSNKIRQIMKYISYYIWIWIY